jgi:hypothetical protein
MPEARGSRKGVGEAAPRQKQDAPALEAEIAALVRKIGCAHGYANTTEIC